MRAWEDFIAKLEKTLGKSTTDEWLRPLKVVHFDSCNLYLEAKDSFHSLWFEEHVRPLLKTEFFNNNFRPIKVHLTCLEDAAKSKKKNQQTSPLKITHDPLDPALTFENFVVGEKNEVIMRFFQELATPEVALGTFNPIYLWGSSGSGKTHLLLALTQALEKKGVKALYAKASTFTEHVVSAIRSSEMKTFRKAYRNASVLLIDDVHQFARKNATQEEFFHTFNALQTTGRQIVLSAACAPQELEDIEPRLISRFEWGINLHLNSLEKAQFRKLLQLRTDSLQLPLITPVQEFLLAHFHTSASLHRALEALILRCHLQKVNPSHITTAIAEDMLSDLVRDETSSKLSPEKIISLISRYFEIAKEDLLGKSQAQEYSTPRQLCMYLCRNALNLPFMAIGRIFNRDHSTVMTSIRLIQKKLEDNDQECATTIAEIKKKF